MAQGVEAQRPPALLRCLVQTLSSRFLRTLGLRCPSTTSWRLSGTPGAPMRPMTTSVSTWPTSHNKAGWPGPGAESMPQSPAYTQGDVFSLSATTEEELMTSGCKPIERV